MKARMVFAGVFLLIGLAAGWMAWLTWQADEDSKWLFAVLAAFFLVLAAVLFLPTPKKKNEPRKVLSTRFVPAWQLEGMILLVLLAIVTSVVAHCAHGAK
jgi:Ca2+/Na+ antiporter